MTREEASIKIKDEDFDKILSRLVRGVTVMELMDMPKIFEAMISHYHDKVIDVYIQNNS